MCIRDSDYQLRLTLESAAYRAAHRALSSLRTATRRYCDQLPGFRQRSPTIDFGDPEQQARLIRQGFRRFQRRVARAVHGRSGKADGRARQ